MLDKIGLSDLLVLKYDIHNGPYIWDFTEISKC